jgi:hypothetical protein
MGFETRTTLFMANRGDSATAIGPTSLDLYWDRCRRREIMRDTTPWRVPWL